MVETNTPTPPSPEKGEGDNFPPPSRGRVRVGVPAKYRSRFQPFTQVSTSESTVRRATRASWPAPSPPPLSRKRERGTLATVLLTLLAGSPTHAQEPPERLDIITVTAQKTVQDEHEVPLSLSVIGASRLERQRLGTLEDATRYAANIQINQVQAYVRGVGTGSNTFGFDPSIGLFVDGIYIGRGSALTMPLWDIDRVEIIRGPQGTLLGKNTLGGAISVNTAMPSTENSGEVSLMPGGLDRYSLRGHASLPLGDDFALRLSGVSEQSTGYIFNSTRGADELGRANEGLRAKLAWRPNGPVSAWLSLESGRSDLDGIGQELSAATPSSLALYRLYDPATEAVAGDGHTAFDKDDTGAVRRADSATLNLEWQLDGLRITALSNLYRSRFDFGLDVDYTAIPLLGVDAGENYRQWSQELRVDGEHQDLDWLAGLYLSGAELAVDNVISVLPRGTAALGAGLDALPPALGGLLAGSVGLPAALDPISDKSRKTFRQDAHSAAAFAQARLAFAQRWSLTAGLRWTLERKQARMRLGFDKTGVFFRQFLGEMPYDETRARRETDLSPRLALQYEASDNIALYASAARGYKSGGYNDFAPTPAALEFDSERAQAVEAGFKSWWLDRRLSLNLALFDTLLRDLQVSAYDGTAFYVQNAARARISGAELESRWRIGRGWSSWASLGLLDARYLSFPNAPVRADQSGDSQDLSGQPTVRAPRRSGGGGVEYEYRFHGGRRLSAGLDALYRSRTFLNLDNDPLDAQPSYTLINASLQLEGAEERWSLTLQALNLTDRYSRNASGDSPLISGDHSVDSDPPRRATLRAQYRW